MAVETHPSSSSSSDNYEVFLSFRGEDTRGTFTDHLYAALVRAGIRTFRDNEELIHGEEIGPRLLKTIEQSRISIPIFSKNYASSKWCLQELTKMMECKETCGQIVWPIFYKVEPSHVRNQTRCFEEAFLKHEKEQGEEKVTAWRKSLKEAGNLKGWDSEDPEYRYETNLINSIVERALSEFIKITLQVAKHPIGIDSHVEELMRMLDIESEGVQFVGIHGMGGIGKTTMAKAVFNKISYQFESWSFLADVRERSQREGLANLQNKLVFDISKGRNLGIDIVDRGINVIKKTFSNKKVLIILDDVDQDQQLDALAGGRDWFGLGSRIIITTRDEHILNIDQVDKSKIYKPNVLDHNLSLQLFSKHAFGRDQPPQDFRELSKKVVFIAGGLPLSLEVMGSFLRDKRRDTEWKSTLKMLKKFPNDEVQKKLQISYDGLNPFFKDIFLDIACFFIGVDEENVIPAWEDSDDCPRVAIKVLVHKSLVKIDSDNKLRMHDQLRDMGREIVRQENRKKPGKRSRLWSHEEALDVLKKHKGTINVEGLFLDFGYEAKSHRIERFVKLPQIDHADLWTKAFDLMSELRLLQVDHAYHDGNFGHLPQGLKWLSWKGISSKCVPTISHLEKLAVLDLSGSMITNDWNGWKQIQLIRTLKVLDLSSCYFLERTPHFSRHTGLERLILDRCTSLVAFHESIGHLHKLVFLSLKHCENLMELPNSICKLSSIRSLILSHCFKLEKLPKELGNMESLTELIIDETRIEEIPDSIGLLEKLERLSARDCRSLVKLPHSMDTMKSLTELIIDGTAIEELPDAVGSLEKLDILSLRQCKKLVKLPHSMKKLSLLHLFDITGTSIVELPEDFGMLLSLEELRMAGCREFKGFPKNFGNLARLSILDANECNLSQVAIPLNFGRLSLLKSLDLSNSRFCSFPASFISLSQLQTLNLQQCTEFQSLPELPSSLIKLNARGCISMERLPNLSNLKSLQALCLSDCRKLFEIQGISGLSLLQQFDLENCTTLQLLPKLARGLIKLNIRGCRSMESLPNLSTLKNLKELRLDNCYELAKIEGIDGLTLLQELDLSACYKLQSLSEIPSSLIKLNATNCSSIERLPNLSNLKKLQALLLCDCKKLSKIQGISDLPLLQQLDLKRCSTLQSLPELPPSLIRLDVSSCISMKRLPNLSTLKHLKEFSLVDCSKLAKIKGIDGLTLLHDLNLTNCEGLQSLPELPSSLIKLDARYCYSIERLANLSNLKSLQVLHLCCSNLSKIQDINGLSLLQELDLEDCKMLQSLPGLPPSLIRLDIKGCISMKRLPKLSCLRSLKVLRLAHCMKLANIQSINDLTLLQELDLRDFSKLQSLSDLPSSLTRLNVYNCENLFEIQGISGLSLLQTLNLEFCPKLQSLPKLPSNLITLDIASCYSMEKLPDLSNLKILENLRLEDCDNLAEIQGLESLESLIDLRVCQCHTCIKTLSKSVAEGRLPTAVNEGEICNNYLMIPDDDNIKGTIFYFVYQLLQDPASSRPFDPDDFYIEAEIQRNDGKKPIRCVHDLRIEGMNANTSKDQFYSCYFQGPTWFGLPLKKWDKIYVRNVGFQSARVEAQNAGPRQSVVNLKSEYEAMEDSQRLEELFLCCLETEGEFRRSEQEVKLKMLDLVMEYEAMEDSQQLKKRVVHLITSTSVEREGARERGDDAGPSSCSGLFGVNSLQTESDFPWIGTLYKWADEAWLSTYK